MMWSREIEGGTFDTPERRAALEARIDEVTNGIADEAVRRYYRQDFAERLRQMFAPARASAAAGRISAAAQARRQAGSATRGASRDAAAVEPRRGAAAPPAAGRDAALSVAASPQLAASPIIAASAAAMSAPRGADPASR